MEYFLVQLKILMLLIFYRMDSDERLSQDELRNSAIRTYSRNIARTKMDAEMSQVDLPLSKELMERMRRHHSPFSCYIDVIKAFGEYESQEYAPPDMREDDAIAHANYVWRRKPRQERDDAIRAFAKRIRDEERDLPEKGARIQRYSVNRNAMIAQREVAKAQPVQGPKIPQEPRLFRRIISGITERFIRRGTK